MQLRVLFLSAVILAFASVLHAQDKIFKKDGEIIDAKIKMVGTRVITYNRFDNPTGPDYTIARTDVDRIKYQNGTEDVFESQSRRGPRHHTKARTARAPQSADGAGDKEKPVNYGVNVVSFAPLQFTENGLGFSLSYERALDDRCIVSFYCPIIASFNLNNGTYYDNNTQSYQNGHQDGMYYAMPGVKIYPTGAYGKVRYSVGPSLVLATGEKSTVGYDIYGRTTYLTKPHDLLGIMVNNTLSINATAKVYLGFDFGFGFSYLNRVDGLNQNSNGLVQGGFKVGYRF